MVPQPWGAGCWLCPPPWVLPRSIRAGWWHLGVLCEGAQQHLQKGGPFMHGLGHPFLSQLLNWWLWDRLPKRPLHPRALLRGLGAPRGAFPWDGEGWGRAGAAGLSRHSYTRLGNLVLVPLPFPAKSCDCVLGVCSLTETVLAKITQLL